MAPDKAPADSHRITTPLYGQKPPEIDGLVLLTALTAIANDTAAPAGVRILDRQISATGNGTSR